MEAGVAAPVSGERLLRWRHAVAAMAPSAAFLAIAWTGLVALYAINEGMQGWRLAAIAGSTVVFTVPLLVTLVALVDALDLRRGFRSVAIAGLALVAGALGGAMDISLLMAIKAWPVPPWSTPVTWWANVGMAASICVGVALVYDYRSRSAARAALLRDARLRSAAVARRTAETRLQAARARVDPRFLFDALSAVERIHDLDAAAGDRLLDNLVAYLRAVLPDLQEAHSTLGHELALARLWLDIRHLSSGTPIAYSVDSTDDALDFRFPPMTLVPLLEACLPRSPHTVTVAVRAQRVGAHASVRIECAVPTHADSPDGATAAEVRGRLRELYGDAAGLTLINEPGRRVAVVEGTFA